MKPIKDHFCYDLDCCTQLRWGSKCEPSGGLESRPYRIPTEKFNGKIQRKNPTNKLGPNPFIVCLTPGGPPHESIVTRSLGEGFAQQAYLTFGERHHYEESTANKGTDACWSSQGKARRGLNPTQDVQRRPIPTPPTCSPYRRASN